ncbi:MarR family winged helix-turn-helix transcriptional regulator [Ochrovirga pacifica]|uniref:MarR family winged helix-turn-helix transcriptional regulator n=1 Tax=Ochrovirga pacifica TaxID=1042376 RepID=UPI000255A021|nr:MarR family transcriptional regulator [Ochrovirga pacifica]
MGDFSKEVNSSFPSETIKAQLNIRYTAQYLSSLTENCLKPYGISNAQYNILRILRGAKEAISMSIVKNRMIEKSPNATRLADKLCEKELIERVRCEKDRRAVYVSITQKGLQLLEQINFSEIEKQIGALSNEEALILNSLLDKIRN